MELTRYSQLLDSWFASHEAEMFEVLERLVNMDSFSHDGASVDRLGLVISDLMREAGFETAVLPKAPIPDTLFY